MTLRTRLAFAGLVFSLAVVAGSAGTAGAAPNPVTATFTINGRSVAHSGSSSPFKLDPTKPAQVGVTLTNNGPTAVTVQSVALSGKALDITFFDFETQTGLQVAPGASDTQQYTLDLAPLNGQADGLIPASIRILDAKRHVLASQAFTADVRGRITSLFGLFAIEITVFTALLFAGALLAMARGRLHPNRFRRGLRFLAPGLGLGIVIVFGFAILRIFVPAPGTWLPVVLICGAIGFGLGYLTPNPANDEYEPDPEPQDPATSPPSDARATLPVSQG